MEPVYEISVRSFYTSKEADSAVSSSAVVQSDGTGRMPDWDKLLSHLIKSVAEQANGLPMTDVRNMTLKEVEIYRAEEANE